MRAFVLSMAVGLWAATVAVAADCCTAPACCDQAQDCCGRCGAKKACKVVCEMKQVKKHVWVVECEEFCAPLPRCGRGCKSCRSGCETGCGETEDCGSCGDRDPCESLRNRCVVPPKCGKVRTRKKLVRKEITCEVPVYKCVVVCCGNGCCEPACGAAEVEAQPEEAPEPPEATTGIAPLPPVVGASYLKSRGIGP